MNESLAQLNASLPPLLKQILTERVVYDSGGKAHELHSNISEEEALKLVTAVFDLKPARTVEIGFAQGISTLAIVHAVAALDGKHHVIDPFQANYADCGVANLERSGLGAYCQFHRDHSENVIPKLDEVDFAFIDSSHLFDLTMVDFTLIDKKLSVGGVIGFHDLWMPSVQRVMRYALSNRRYEFYAVPGPSQRRVLRQRLVGGVAALLRKIPKASRIFSMDVLEPWSSFKLGNIGFLRKTIEDTREWTFHQPF